MNKHLRSLFPIPEKWEGSAKTFAIRLEDAFKWLQTKCDIYDKRVIKEVAIGSSSNKTIDLASGGRYLIITHSTATTVQQIMLVSVNSSGVVSVTEFRTASNLTADTSTANKLKLTNGATNPLTVYIEKLA